jgi:hypothetical protein
MKKRAPFAQHLSLANALVVARPLHATTGQTTPLRSHHSRCGVVVLSSSEYARARAVFVHITRQPHRPSTTTCCIVTPIWISSVLAWPVHTTATLLRPHIPTHLYSTSEYRNMT